MHLHLHLPLYLHLYLRFHTSTSMTAEEIHAKGVEEVARIEGEMREVIKELGLTTSLSAFIEQLREDKANFFPTKEELLAAFDTIIRKRVEPQLGKIFHNMPVKGVLEVNHLFLHSPSPLLISPLSSSDHGGAPGRLPRRLLHRRHAGWREAEQAVREHAQVREPA